MASYTVEALFDKYGKDSTIRTFSRSGSTNDQGEYIYDESTQDGVKVIIGWEGRHPNILEQAVGESVMVEEQLFAITDHISLDVSTDSVDKKPHIEHGGETWKVERTIESPDPPGITMFQTQRNRQ